MDASPDQRGQRRSHAQCDAVAHLARTASAWHVVAGGGGDVVHAVGHLSAAHAPRAGNRCATPRTGRTSGSAHRARPHPRRTHRTDTRPTRSGRSGPRRCRSVRTRPSGNSATRPGHVAGGIVPVRHRRDRPTRAVAARSAAPGAPPGADPLRDVDSAFDGLLSHRFDVILGERYPGVPDPVRDGTERSDLVDDPILLAVPSTGPWSVSSPDLALLADAPWALDEAHTGVGIWARAICHAAGFTPRVSFEGPDPYLQAQLVRTGHAVAFLPGLTGYRAATADDRMLLTTLTGSPHRSLYTAVRSGRASHPAIRSFRTALTDVIDERVR